MKVKGKRSSVADILDFISLFSVEGKDSIFIEERNVYGCDVKMEEI